MITIGRFGERISRKWTLIALVLLSITGCASPRHDSALAIHASQYEDAFDAASTTVRDAGFRIAVLDRRQGLIETEPQHAETLLEPWRLGVTDAAQNFENTVSHQRRRVRFEFSPSTTDADDLDSERLLRVVVSVERSQDDPKHRSTWSRRASWPGAQPIRESRRSVPTGPEPQVWTPVGRDSAMEQKLAGDVERILRASEISAEN